MLCAICGKKLSGKLNTDHVFPRSVYKWLENMIGAEEYGTVYALIESGGNKIPVHKACNERKNDALPELGALYLTREKSEALYSLEKDLSAFTPTYTALKERLYEKQENSCFSCGVPLGKKGVLRRIDPGLPRTEENGCLVCAGCNEKYPDFKNVKT